jgi:hypothetical protein
VYRITSAHLKQAAGEVQCGQCEARFDALDSLSDVFPKSAEGPAPRLPLPAEETAREEEAPAEEAPEEEAPEEEAPEEEAPEEEAPEEEATEEEAPEEEAPEEEAPEEEATEEEAPEEEAPEEEAPEEEAPEEEATEEEVPEEEAPEEEAPEEEAPEEEAQEEEAPEEEATEEEATEEEATEEETPEEETPEEEAASEEAAEEPGRPADEDHAREKVSAGDDDEPTINLDQTAEQLFAIEDLSDQVLPDLARMEFAEGLPLEVEAEAGDITEAEQPPAELAGRRAGGFVGWMLRVLIVVAVLGLGAYLLHSQRGLLMRYPAVAPWLEAVYGRLGMGVQTTWDVGRFRILDSSVELDDAGDLQVRLSFMNEGEFAQPYPTLKIVLEDRWGDEIGLRDLPPSEFLAGYEAGRPFLPGERAAGRATVTGPELAAVGFRLDLCLPRGSGPTMDCLSEQP